MAQLFVLSGADVGRSFEVRGGDAIGRSGDCVVVLKDRSVSRRHAHLEEREGAWSIVDDGSRNGITIAEGRLLRAELPDGQEFLLGEVLLRFRSVATAPQPAQPPAPAPIDFPEPPPTLSVPPPRAAPPAGPAEEVFLEAAGEIELAARKAPADDSRAALAEQRGRVLQYHRFDDSGSKLSSELAQMPAWVRLSLWLLAVALLIAMFWLAFSGAAFVRGKVQPATSAEEPR